MPEISRFLGIIIRMFGKEHPPPHFHAIHGEYEAQYDIRTLQLLEGKLPSSAHRLVLKWARLHQAELLRNWELLDTEKTFEKIKPLR